MDEEQTEPGKGLLAFDPARTRTGTVPEQRSRTGEVAPAEPGTEGLPLFTQLSRLTGRVEALERQRTYLAVALGALGGLGVVLGCGGLGGVVGWLVH